MGDVAAALTWPPGRQGPCPSLPSGAPAGPRRCLFGAVDRGETRRWQEQQMREMAAQDRVRWNFDFDTDSPLPAGRYDWQEADKFDADKREKELVQKRITDFMRKRKAQTDQKVPQGPAQKACRRSST